VYLPESGKRPKELPNVLRRSKPNAVKLHLISPEIYRKVNFFNQHSCIFFLKNLFKKLFFSILYFFFHWSSSQAKTAEICLKNIFAPCLAVGWKCESEKFQGASVT
jgi:hypothetical protein